MPQGKSVVLESSDKECLTLNNDGDPVLTEVSTTVELKKTFNSKQLKCVDYLIRSKITSLQNFGASIFCQDH